MGYAWNGEKMGIEEKDKENTGMSVEKSVIEEKTAAGEEHIMESADTGKEGRKGKREKRQKKPRKANRAAQKMLCILQHIALTVMVIAILVVVGSSYVRVNYSSYNKTTGFYLYNQDRSSIYEDSNMFNILFGYALSDIVRHGVVSSQLETDGSFDGSKVIDVTAYNYRNGELPERYVTAEYYLGDLLKWSNYGFEWSSVQMTPGQARNFLADMTRVTIVDSSSDYYNTSDASYLKSDVGSYTYVKDVSANQLWVDMDEYDGFVGGYPTETTEDAEIVVDYGSYELKEVEILDEPAYDSDGATIKSYNVMVNRYKTTEKKNLEEYVSDWDLYHDLCVSVQTAANGLSYNYNEYLENSEYYKAANSNVRYIIMKQVDGEDQIYTNFTDQIKFEDIAAGMLSGDASGELLKNAADRYIYYSPADMVYRTNTNITEHTVREVFQGYDYAYPESVKLWVSVDSEYPANDGFRQGMIGYNDYRPNIWYGICVGAIAGVLYLVILFYLTYVTGKDVDEDGRAYIRLTSFDKVPTEITILLAGGVVVLAVFALIVLCELTNIDPSDVLSMAEGVVSGQWLWIIFAVGVFAADSIIMLFFYSLVRRIRAKALWANSYLCMLIMRVVRFAWKVYDNGDIVIRTWIPYIAFLLYNFIVLLFAFQFLRYSEEFGAFIVLIFAVAIDIIVGNLIFRNAKEQQEIVKGIETIAGGQLDHKVETENLHGNNLTLANSVNSIGSGIKEAVEISMRDERMKADLITNVSHDIKTPLTSIINYVDLIKREQVEDEKIRGYINVLDEKSQRLKQLTDDLVEASKISSGNITLHFEKINLTELMNQTLGEFSEKFEKKRLTAVLNINVQNAVIEADSRRIWRVIENLFNNIFKYAMEGTRVYLAVDRLPDKVGYIALSVKNISASPLNCDPEELTERFIRGDESRTTEGSGLGLSIAKNLTEAQNGTFDIQLDGDLFKVILTFPLAEN